MLTLIPRLADISARARARGCSIDASNNLGRDEPRPAVWPARLPRYLRGSTGAVPTPRAARAGATLLSALAFSLALASSPETDWMGPANALLTASYGLVGPATLVSRTEDGRSPVPLRAFGGSEGDEPSMVRLLEERGGRVRIDLSPIGTCHPPVGGALGVPLSGWIDATALRPALATAVTVADAGQAVLMLRPGMEAVPSRSGLTVRGPGVTVALADAPADVVRDRFSLSLLPTLADSGHDWRPAMLHGRREGTFGAVMVDDLPALARDGAPGQASAGCLEFFDLTGITAAAPQLPEPPFAASRPASRSSAKGPLYWSDGEILHPDPFRVELPGTRRPYARADGRTCFHGFQPWPGDDHEVCVADYGWRIDQEENEDQISIFEWTRLPPLTTTGEPCVAWLDLGLDDGRVLDSGLIDCPTNADQDLRRWDLGPPLVPLRRFDAHDAPVDRVRVLASVRVSGATVAVEANDEALAWLYMTGRAADGERLATVTPRRDGIRQAYLKAAGRLDEEIALIRGLDSPIDRVNLVLALVRRGDLAGAAAVRDAAPWAPNAAAWWLATGDRPAARAALGQIVDEALAPDAVRLSLWELRRDLLEEPLLEPLRGAPEMAAALQALTARLATP